MTTVEQLVTFERVTREGFPIALPTDAPPFSLFGPDLLAPPDIRLWLADLDGEAAGVAMTSVAHGINRVNLIATLPSDRGRGVGTALTWSASRADPSLPAMLVPSDEGRRVYDHMGYLPLHRWTVWWRVRA